MVVAPSGLVSQCGSQFAEPAGPVRKDVLEPDQRPGVALLAADLSRPSTSAASPLERCSKCRSARISRSSGSRLFSDSCSGSSARALARPGWARVPAQELGRHAAGRLWACAPRNREISRPASRPGTQVAAMLFQQPLAGENRSQRQKGIVGSGDTRAAGGGLQHRVLDDVRGVHSALEPGVEAQRDHATQAVAMPGQQLAPGLLAPWPARSISPASRLRRIWTRVGGSAVAARGSLNGRATGVRGKDPRGFLRLPGDTSGLDTVEIVPCRGGDPLISPRRSYPAGEGDARRLS